MVGPAFQYRERGRQAFVCLIAVVILFGLPVECTVIHGPHSIFAPPASLAAMAKPGPDEQSRAQAGVAGSHESQFSAFHLDSQHEHRHAPTLAGGSALAGRLMPTTGLVHPAAVEPASPPRVVALAVTTSASSIPAALDTSEVLVPAIPVALVTWLEASPPPARLLPAPEPPP